MPAVRALVAAQLGPAFTEAPPLDLGACLADSAPARPLIFILSPRADPMAALAQLAAEQVGAAAAMRFIPCHVSPNDDSVGRVGKNHEGMLLFCGSLYCCTTNNRLPHIPPTNPD